MASMAAQATTAGVYTLAKRVIKLSVTALFAAESSTSSSMRDTVESTYSQVVRTLSRPFILTQPLITLSPTDTSLGRDSPVSAMVLRAELPSITMPSSGTRSPGFITIILPTGTSSGSVSVISPSPSRFAYSGIISIRAAMEARLLPTAICSKSSPTL